MVALMGVTNASDTDLHCHICSLLWHALYIQLTFILK